MWIIYQITRVQVLRTIYSTVFFLFLFTTLSYKTPIMYEQGSFLHEHARPLNKRCVWRLTTGSAFIKMARLKAIVAIIFLVGLGECARDLTKCVVCKKTVTWS